MAPEKLAEIKKKLEPLTQSILDELVHELKSEEASSLNNEGTDAQLAYIVEAMGENAYDILTQLIAEETE
jgi:hypothetical protein